MINSAARASMSARASVPSSCSIVAVSIAIDGFEVAAEAFVDLRFTSL